MKNKKGFLKKTAVLQCHVRVLMMVWCMVYGDDVVEILIKGFSEKNCCFTVSRASFNDGMVYGDDVVEILVVSCFLFFSRSLLLE